MVEADICKSLMNKGVWGEGYMRFKMLCVVAVLGFVCGLSISCPKPDKRSKDRPHSFVETMEPTWASVELRKDLEYEKAWATVVDLLTKQFDMAILSKENGYARTIWLYTWTGKMREDYRVRITVKFSTDRTKVEIKSEANYLVEGKWVVGTDTALLQTLKTDIMGTVGRTTR